MRRTLLIGAACLVVGLALGRYSAAPAEETHHETASEEIAVETSETTEAQEVAHHEAATMATERTEATAERVRVVWRERIVQADGATEEREMELDAEVARLVHEAEAARREVARLEAQLAHQTTETVEVVREVEVVRQVRAPLPDWRLSGMVGLDIPGAHAVYGASVERRILGPIHVGAWGLSSGSFGVAAGVVW